MFIIEYSILEEVKQIRFSTIEQAKICYNSFVDFYPKDILDYVKLYEFKVNTKNNTIKKILINSD